MTAYRLSIEFLDFPVFGGQLTETDDWMVAYQGLFVNGVKPVHCRIFNESPGYGLSISTLNEYVGTYGFRVWSGIRVIDGVMNRAG